MVLNQIINPVRQVKYVWLNTLALMAFLVFGIADPLAVIMIYFLETIIIGLDHFFKMCFVYLNSQAQLKLNQKSSSLKIGFFLMHYMFFVAVPSIFVFAIFSFSDSAIKDPLDILYNFEYVLSLKGIYYGLITMFIMYSLQTYFGFVRTKIYNSYTLDKLLFQPYVRIFIQQFTVIVGMFFAVVSASGTIVAILLIIFRLIVDLLINFIPTDNAALKLTIETLDNTFKEK